MPYGLRKIGGVFRVVDPYTGEIAKGKSGKPMDGGGHKNKNKALRQISAVELSESQKIDKVN